jgi:hypothetical protein
VIKETAPDWAEAGAWHIYGNLNGEPQLAAAWPKISEDRQAMYMRAWPER